MANDLNGLPDVNLTPEVIKDFAGQQDTQDKGQQSQQGQGQVQQQKQVPPKPDTKDTGFAQFKDADALLKGYKELQAAFTQSSSKSKELEQKIAELEQERELLQGAGSYATQPQYPNQTETNDDPAMQFLSNPSKAVADQVNLTLIGNEIEKEQVKDRAAFPERYAYVKELAAQYPHLTKSPAGVSKLFEQADKVRKDRTKTIGIRTMEAIFGQPLNQGQLEKLGQLIGIAGEKGEQTGQSGTNVNLNSGAYMPDSSSVSRNRSGTGTPTHDDKIRDAANKGDVDATIDALFQKVLSE